MEIKVKKTTQKDLDGLNVKTWPIWSKQECSFDWYYGETEICYFLEGEVEVEVPGGRRIKMQKGDLVTFPKGLKCIWHVKKKVRKHYNFE